MTTVADINTRILYPMRDATQEYFVDAELLSYINEALIDLSLRERLFREAATVVTASGALPLAADMAQIRWVKNPDGVEVAWMDESVFFDYQATFLDWSADSPLATIYEDKIWLHPAPADGENWTVGYYGLPTAMTGDADTIPVGRQWEEKIVRYCRAECYFRLGEVALGDRERSRYEEGLRDSQPRDRQIPGRLTFSYEPNVFDADPESIHRGM